MDDSKPEGAQELEWVRRCKQGERNAFAFLVERYRRRVFGLVFHLVRRPDQVEDLAQEIFLKAFLGLKSYNFQASFVTWLSQIAVNHCYDFLRHERVSRVAPFASMTEERQRELEASLESPAPGGLTAEQRTIVADLVGKLLERAPADDRVLLTLKELEGLSIEEMAEILKLKPGTVKVRLHRARRRMLEDLKRWQKGR